MVCADVLETGGISKEDGKEKARWIIEFSEGSKGY